MALALIARKEINLHVFLDERSAAFAALGVGLQHGMPAVVLSTSGTAAVEFHPAVVEAHEARIPMLVCTADRPPELHGVGAPQSIDQQHLYGSSVRLFVDSGVADDTEMNEWRLMAQRALAASRAIPAGPVHLNLAFREPLIASPNSLPVSTDAAIPLTEIGMPNSQDVAWVNELCARRHGVIVAGRGVRQPASIVALAERLGWPLIADPRSGCRRSEVSSPVLVPHADAIVRHESVKLLKPEVILRFGEPPTSKVVNGWLAASGANYVVVSPSDALHDPDRVVERQFLADIEAFASLIEGEPSGPDWLSRWQQMSTLASDAIQTALDESQTLNEPLVARVVGEYLPQGSSLMVSSSMPIRDLEWFSPTIVPEVLANRGANGIDGVVSTALGVALATGATVGALVGDIAFLHDANALLGLARRGVDLRVVVVDNDGGGIFSFLPQATQIDPDVFETLYGTPHGADLLGIATAYGVKTVQCVTKSELITALASRGPIVIYVRTSRIDNVEIHDRLNRAVTDALSHAGL